jgi:glycosyltransferase involved in cell wall biosynthesis
MRETVKHGETGWIVKTEKEFKEVVKELKYPDSIHPKFREKCREWASQFSIDRMINRYEELCIEAKETGGW